jgi:integrase
MRDRAMAREIHRLTPLKVERAKLPEGKTTLMLPDGGGLYLQLKKSGDKGVSVSWVFRYATGAFTHSKAGKRRPVERLYGIGPLHTVGLKDARVRAAALRLARRDGKDPIVEREMAEAASAVGQARVMTFEKAAAALIASKEAGWKNAKHSSQWEATLKTYVYPIFGKVDVRDVDTGLVMKSLEPIWREVPETASRVRGRIETVLDWAKVRGHRAGDNPARWRGHLEVLLPLKSKVAPVEHFAALPYAELGDFLTDLRGRPATAARALEFLILTSARTNEALGCSWEQINLQDKTWTVAGENMKSTRAHRVPLTGHALRMLEAVEPKDRRGYVFPSARGGQMSNMAMLKLLERMGREDITVHGFRATFKTWATECTNFQRETVEAALAHAAGDKMEAAYQRGDLFEKRRRLMSAWDEFCSNPSVKQGSNVLILREK